MKAEAAPALLAMAMLLGGGGECHDRPPAAYASPEALLDDYDDAMRVTTSTHDVAFALARYFACVSLRADSEAVCAGIDSRMDVYQHASWTCRKYRLNGLRFAELVRGSGTFENCVRDDRDMPEEEWEGWDSAEAAQACREAAVFYRSTGSLEGYCARMLAHSAPAPNREYELTDLSDCRRRFVYLGDSEAGCAAHENEQMRVNCVEEFRLVKALRENKPEVAAETAFAPILDRKASCAGLGRSALELYEKHRMGGGAR